MILSTTGGAFASDASDKGLPLWGLGIGVAAYHQPNYPGSDVRSTTGFPFPYVMYRGDWFRIDRSLQGIPASCINYPSQSVFAAQKVLFSGQNGVWLKFTPGEVKTHGKIACRMW